METPRPVELLASCARRNRVADFFSYLPSVLCGFCDGMMQLPQSHLLLHAMTIKARVCQVGLWENPYLVYCWFLI